jgi:hypothetical protein
MSDSKRRRLDWREVQRKRRFRQFYLQTGNALQSALAAGYAEVTARTQSARLAAAAEETLRDQCDFLGLTKLVLIKTLAKHLQAKTPKWNAKTERWDLFEDTLAQREAYDRLKTIIEPEEPRFVNTSIKIGVAVAAEDAKPEAWLERNKDRIKAGVSVTVEQSGPSGSGNLRQTLASTGRPPNGSDNGEVGS